MTDPMLTDVDNSVLTETAALHERAVDLARGRRFGVAVSPSAVERVVERIDEILDALDPTTTLGQRCGRVLLEALALCDVAMGGRAVPVGFAWAEAEAVV